MSPLRVLSTIALLSLVASPDNPAMAQTSAFTYQGQLIENGRPANGSYNLMFKLFDTAGGSSQIGLTITRKGVVLNDGLFAQSLDFGAAAFTGGRRWLEVTANGSVLSPRQEITAVPYALSVPGLSTSEDGVVVSGDVHAAGAVVASAFSSNSPLIFKVNPTNTECARFNDTNCYLGLGTTNPQARLHIGGVAGIDGIEFPDGSLQTTAAGSGGGDGFWSANAANIYNNNGGNVGIGTTTPHHRLRISGGSTWTSFFWNGALELDNASAIAWQSNVAGSRFGIGQTNGGLLFFNTSSDPGTTGSPANYRMIISDAGNVGIGETTPQFPLTIHKSDSVLGSGYGWVHTNGTVEVGSYLSSSGGWLGTRSNHPLYLFTNDASPQVTLTTAGALGIGTLTVPAGVRLAVAGKVLCEEMEVQLADDWPDYVFDDSYVLMPLSELEKIVEKQKHLPGIPRAADIAKNGLKVGQMQSQLVEKVEELTLYMIQMNKHLERVELENAELKTRLSALEGTP